MRNLFVAAILAATSLLSIGSAEANACFSSIQCSSNESCVNFQCTPNNVYQCMWDQDCALNQICLNNQCVYSNPQPQCQYNNQCPWNQVCVAGQCVINNPPPPVCKPAGMLCGQNNSVCCSNVCIRVPGDNNNVCQ